MLQRIKTFLLVLLGFMPLALATAPVYAIDCTNAVGAQAQIQCGVNGAAGTSEANADAPKQISTTVKNILNIMSAVAGVAAVVILVVAGIRFVASAGSENAVKGAKTSIIYAVIGIIIVALAQVIVHFVINSVTSTSQ